MGPIGCPETQVTNYQPILCSIPKQQVCSSTDSLDKTVIKTNGKLKDASGENKVSIIQTSEWFCELKSAFMPVNDAGCSESTLLTYSRSRVLLEKLTSKLCS
jgi:hypothetical protein